MDELLNPRVTPLSGTSARLGVTVTGGVPPYTYQWQQKGSWIDIPNATSAEFTWEGLTPGQTYTVRCVVKDRRGAVVYSPEMTFIAGGGPTVPDDIVVNPPKTGDSAGNAGFILLGLGALMGLGAELYRKKQLR